MTGSGRIVIVEDHTLLRAGLRALLAQNDEFEVIADFDNARDAIRSLSVLAPDLVMLDLSMPGMNGIEAITEIKRRQPDVRVLILTIQRGQEFVLDSLRAGANGYMLKDATHDELRVALRNVLAGKTYLSPDVSGQVVTGFLGKSVEGSAVTPSSTLTHREREVLKLVAEGYPNRAIAEFLSLSIKTVEKHRANVMAKLHLHNASDLTAYAIDRGLVEGRSTSVNGAIAHGTDDRMKGASVR